LQDQATQEWLEAPRASEWQGAAADVPYQPPAPAAEATHAQAADAPATIAAATAYRGWSTRSLVFTGILCFICGALTWHLVGFWSFVSAILYKPDRTDSASRPAPVATVTQPQPAAAKPPSQPQAATASDEKITKAPHTIDGVARPPATADTLADLLQCAEARKSDAGAVVAACPPLRRRLPVAVASTRGNRQLDAREAARRLTSGWQTGVATIETGSLPKSR